MRRVKVIISGNVIGVFFRSNIKKRALDLNLKGYVRNLDDMVEAVFEGSSENIEKILEFCRKGPLGAKVEKVEIKEEKYNKEEFKEFEIKY